MEVTEEPEDRAQRRRGEWKEGDMEGVKGNRNEISPENAKDKELAMLDHRSRYAGLISKDANIILNAILYHFILLFLIKIAFNYKVQIIISSNIYNS